MANGMAMQINAARFKIFSAFRPVSTCLFTPVILPQRPSKHVRPAPVHTTAWGHDSSLHDHSREERCPRLTSILPSPRPDPKHHQNVAFRCTALLYRFPVTDRMYSTS